MFEVLLIDLDDTILDFHKAERVAVEKTLASIGIAPTQEVCTRYSRINQEHWERLERKELTREQVLVGRFAVLFEQLGIIADAVQTAQRYGENLGVGHYFLPGAREALEDLFGKYRMYIVSNGTAKVQAGRLESANIRHFFEDIFISQNLGVNKPDRRFFEACFAQIPDCALDRTMIVGDSLTSDILGGKNAGVATCWVNPRHKDAPDELCPDYEIESLAQLPALLETL